jgi:hypothetical protein
MKLLEKYLSKYKTLTPPQATKTKIIAQVIQDECGITIPHTNITMRRGGAIISCHPTVRSEVGRCIPQLLTVLQKEHNLRLSFIR